MKSRSLIPLLLLCIGITVGTQVPSAQAETRVSLSFFYNNLSPYGEWVSVGDYGDAWHPNEVDNEWSPYSEGSWAYTEDGWTWVSDEPWADITYHYGRWVDVAGYGWCWVPGYEWAPAWVSWRSSDDYVGWAPLPPEAVWQPTIGFSIWTDSYYDIGPRYYRFCRVRDFCEPNMRRVSRPWRENISLMSVTFNITNINYNNDDRRVFCGGPNLNFLNDRTARPVRHLRLIEEARYQRSSVRGDDYRVFRPSIDRDEDRNHSRGKVARSFDHGRVDRGWRESGNENERHDLRSRLQDQVRGLNPQNAPATLVSKTSGGLSSRELHAKHDRRSDVNDKSKGPMVDPRLVGDRNGDRRDDEKPKGPFVDPRRPDRKDDERGMSDKGDKPRPTDKPKIKIVDPRRPDPRNDNHEDIRRGIPSPRDQGPGMKGDDDKNKPVDPRKAVRGGDDNGPDSPRKGIPVPPSVKPPTSRDDRDKNEGTSRPPVPRKGFEPDQGPSRKESPDRPTMPKRPEVPKKKIDSPRPEARSPSPVKVPQERPSMPKKQEPPKVQQRPPSPKKVEAPKVERKAPASSPKPSSFGKRGNDSDKKKDSKKRDKDDR